MFLVMQLTLTSMRQIEELRLETKFDALGCNRS